MGFKMLLNKLLELVNDCTMVLVVHEAYVYIGFYDELKFYEGYKSNIPEVYRNCTVVNFEKCDGYLVIYIKYAIPVKKEFH